MFQSLSLTIKFGEVGLQSPRVPVSRRLSSTGLPVSGSAAALLLHEVGVLGAIMDESVQVVCFFGRHAHDELSAVLGVGMHAPAQAGDAPVRKQRQGRSS